MDYYEKLGLPKDALSEEIRAAYFELARQLHPDVNKDPNSQIRFYEIKEAYEVLIDEERRKDYDRRHSYQLVTPEVSLITKFSRSAVPLLDEPQIFYALMDFMTFEEFDPLKLPAINLCLVLDRSTSMAGKRLEMVKANISQLMKVLRPQDVLSIAVFSDKAEIFLPPTRVSELTHIDTKVASLQTGGSTEIYKGLELSVSLLKSSASSSSIKQIILLTDGHTYGDEEACFTVAKASIEAGITINALGIGHEWNDAFLDQVTGLSGGNASYAGNAQHLNQLLVQKVNSIVKIYARGVTFDFSLCSGVELRYAFRLSPDLAPLENSPSMVLGNIVFGKPLTILFELLILPLAAETQDLPFCKGFVRMELPNKTASASRIRVELSRPVHMRLEREAHPPAIVDAMARLTLYRMQEKARQEVSEGKTEKASRHLQYLASHLLTSDRELAHTVLMEAEHIQQSHSFSSEGDKRIKYGTRALLLLPGPEQNKP
jgi:Ca-activated chloride channel family protein